jgi:hypothetical protein
MIVLAYQGFRTMATPAEIAAKKLAWEVGSRKSVELNITTKITAHIINPNFPKGFDSLEEHYIETAAGQRFGEMQGLKSGKVVTRIQHFSDGSKFADVQFSARNPDRQMNIFIKRQYATEGQDDRKEIPQPLLYLYVGRTPLHEALPKGQYLGTDKVMGRECDLYLFTKVRWAVVQDQVFHLDRETAIPLKVEIFLNQAARERKETAAEWVAESLDKVQGHYIPLKSTLIARNPEGMPKLTWNYTVKMIAFDKEYPASTFWPTPQPGVTMFDATTGKAKTLPGEKTAESKATIPAREDTGSQTQSSAAPSTASTQAVPPENWSASTSKVSLGLGCAILFAGLLLWWRRGYFNIPLRVKS